MSKSVRLRTHDFARGTSATNGERPFDPNGAMAHKPPRNRKAGKGSLGTLRRSLAREHALVNKKEEQLRQSELLRDETSHRVMNDLQLVASLLSLQSRSVNSPEAAFELKVAAERVAVIGRIHRQIRLLEGREVIDLRACLEELRDDISVLFALDASPRRLVLEAIDVKLPASRGLPLVCIANELITNAVKHGAGGIVVRVRPCVEGYELSVSDDGPGLPKEFDWANRAGRKGLGMKIVRALVGRIGGRFEWGVGERHRGARVSVIFPSRSAGEESSKAMQRPTSRLAKECAGA